MIYVGRGVTYSGSRGFSCSRKGQQLSGPWAIGYRRSSLHAFQLTHSLLPSRPVADVCHAASLNWMQEDEESSLIYRVAQKSKLYICDHNSGKTHSIVIIFAFL